MLNDNKYTINMYQNWHNRLDLSIKKLQKPGLFQWNKLKINPISLNSGYKKEGEEADDQFRAS